MYFFTHTRVEQLIADVNQCIETSQSLCERVCKDLRPLLHQPWPPKEKPSPKPSPQTDSSVGDHGDAVSLEDAETLAKVELALVRAQKARDLQRKVRTGPNFMALLTISIESALTEAENSVLTATCFTG